MNKTIFAALLFGIISLSSFTKEPVNYEQIAFDYFFSDIFQNDFKNLSAIEFKGKTEGTFSTLGSYKFWLKPKERLQSLMQAVTKGPVKNLKEIRYDQIKNITVADFKRNSNSPKLLIYHAVRVADNFYVFLSVQLPDEPFANYVFELTVDGAITRNCKMD